MVWGYALTEFKNVDLHRRSARGNQIADYLSIEEGIAAPVLK